MKGKAKRSRLEANGWKVGTVAEFLDLAPEESALIETKLALSRRLARASNEAEDAGRNWPMTAQAARAAR